MKSDLPYRPAVGIMMLDDDNQVFVAKRIDTIAEAWQMPQGGIDDGENPPEAAIRELNEETSVTNITIIKESDEWLYYDLPDELVNQVWGGKYKGQKQKWFAVRFNGNDDDINLETQHPEFYEWKWIAHNTLPDIIVPFKRKLYKSILEEFYDIF